MPPAHRSMTRTALWWCFCAAAAAGCTASGLPYTPNSEGAPTLLWHVGQGTDQEEHVHEGMETSDGGFVAIGQANEASGDSTDVLIIKVDAQGQLQWQQQLGTAGEMDVGIAIVEMADGGFVAGGGLHHGGVQQRALVRLTAGGDVLWSHVFEHDGIGAVRGLSTAEDGAVVATGYTQAEAEGFLFIAEDGQGFLMQVDADGALQWEQPLTAPQGTKVHPRDGGYRVLSTGWDVIDGEDRMVNIILHTDASGMQTGMTTHGSEGINQAFDFDQTADGGAIIAGHTTGYGSENWDCLLMRVDASGELMWSETFGQPRGYDAQHVHDECYGVRSLPDGGFVVTGGTGDEYRYSADGHPSGTSDEWKVFLIRTDADGALVWQNVYGDAPGAGHNAGEFLGLTADGGFVVFTDTDSAGSMAPNNMGFMKLSAEE